MSARRCDLWGLDALLDVVGANAILTAHANASITLLSPINPNGSTGRVVLNAISPNFDGNLWKFAEQADALGIKDIGSPAKRPLAEKALKELDTL